MRANGWEEKDTNKDCSDNNSISNQTTSAMKSALILTAISLLTAAVRGSVVELETRATGGYVQNPSGTASFTFYSGCSSPGKQREAHTTAAHTLSTVSPQRVANPPPASQPR